MPPDRESVQQKKSARSCLNRLLKFDAGIRESRGEECVIVGIDEVGRGSLIGPVVAGAVCLPHPMAPVQRKLLKAMNDSKQLTPELRAELSEAIHILCFTGIGWAEKEEVDRLNLHYASLLALGRAFEDLCRKQSEAFDRERCYLLIDGKFAIPDYPVHTQQPVIKGDGRSAAIAAASIIAKHYRDTWVKELAKEWPGYGWEENMGYATPAHLDALARLGPTPLHRVNFRRVHEQLTLLPR